MGARNRDYVDREGRPVKAIRYTRPSISLLAGFGVRYEEVRDDKGIPNGNLRIAGDIAIPGDWIIVTGDECKVWSHGAFAQEHRPAA